MGLGRGSIKLLIQEAKKRSFRGKVLTLGKQDTWVNERELEAIASEFQFTLFPYNGSDPYSLKPEMRERGFISDVYLLTRLGFSECKSMDYSAYEKADYVFDLNESDPPENLLNSFDVIIDGGTLEHVFHLPNALSSIFKMLNRGGRVIHISPSSNYVDHGFYMFSPTLFADYYRENRFDMNEFQIIKHDPWHNPWKVYRYQPGCLNSVSYGGLDNAMYAIHCVATKTSHSTTGKIPQQRNYLEGAWSQKSIAANSLLNRMKEKIKRISFLYRILRPFSRFFRPGLKLKVMARF